MVAPYAVLCCAVVCCGVVWCGVQIRDKLKQLKLNDAEVWALEERRKQTQGDVPAPVYIKAPFWLLCVVLDVFFANRWARVASKHRCMLYRPGLLPLIHSP
jgi:hypothetical protein